MRSNKTAAGQTLWLCRTGEPGRAELEALLAKGYREAYGAELYHFLPFLLGLADEDGPRAAIGMAPGIERMFLDVYVDRPAVELLELALGTVIPAERVCEIGNLYAASRGLGTAAIGAMSSYLDGRGIPWALFTATRPLRMLFERLGAEVLPLSPADPRRLGARQGAWGTYYDSDPVVVATFVPEVRRACARKARGSEELLSAAYLEGLRAAGGGDRLTEAV